MASEPILIVEDDAGIQTMLQLALAERGHDTVCAASLQDAVAVLAEVRPRLILLDVLLRGIDALDLATRPEVAGVPIVVMTASENAAAAAARIGAAGWLSKPFDLDDVYAIAERYAPTERPP